MKKFTLKFSVIEKEKIRFDDKEVTIPEMERRLLEDLLRFARAGTKDINTAFDITDTITQIKTLSAKAVLVEVSKEDIKWIMAGFQASVNNPMRDLWFEKCSALLKQIRDFSKK